MPRIRKTAAVVTAAALIGGGGLSAAQAATGDGGSRPARSGPPSAPMNSASLANIAATLGVTTAQLRTALDANRPAKPPRAARGAGGMATALATALGVDVADVQEILAANRPARSGRGTRAARPPRGAKPSHTKLIAALASGLNLDTATVKAAFTKIEAARKAEHAARAAAMYAAIASDLGLSADAVKAAFEANRPAR